MKRESIKKVSDTEKPLKRVKKTVDGSSKDKKTKSTTEMEPNGLFAWCSVYPGSLPSLASPDIKPWNVKLASWNVNGLRAWIKAGGQKYVIEESPDIFAVQEIKCSALKVPAESQLSGYTAYWSPADKEGYAGTGLYCKKKPTNLKLGMEITKHDTEGRIITAEYEKFYFVNAYVPNSGQGLVRLPYREKQWDPDFVNYLKRLDSHKPLIVCGDLNVAHEEIDLANPSTNHKSAGFTDQERAGFGVLLNQVDLVDTYRALYPDRLKAYTFWNYRQNARPKNTGWRLDYFLVSKRLMPHVCDHEIRCGVRGSDHCPIVLYLKL
ncbi:DNA-(apurinic or apyrimidinic site) lyase [Fasciola hepatica]|uniref:exodeoxyribonuclease III n=1 Tax=Fasciola hepatica TaxID=6192 RepID=A0A4E0R9P4_FASHE|nr:DNA-(apurinic or apyrimidinic site) lyase [Fasciola hepatica]